MKWNILSILSCKMFLSNNIVLEYLERLEKFYIIIYKNM